jgi:peptidoglycan/xylan/chitin deacetylase (PgdA/CDA1 family)
MRFFRTPFLLPLLYPRLIWRMPSTGKELYLTFDDGPVPGPTEFVLDVLKQYRVTASFFCIGDNVRQYPEIFLRILREGHAVGNHTYHHLNGWKTPAHDYMINVRMFDATAQAAGYRPVTRYFRPPYGRITRTQIGLLKDYSIVMWDVLSYDFSSSLSPDECLDQTTRASRPGSIVVFHDSHKAWNNLSFVLPRYIENMRNEGYTFHTLT